MGSTALKILKERLKGIYLHRHNLWDMAAAQLKTKYVGSVLGISWAVINPLLIASVIAFVFFNIFKIEIKDFPLFVLSGIFPWMFFSCALSEATFSILNQQNILHQFNLPREILPMSSILSNFLNFLIGWFVIFPLFLFFNPRIILFLPLLTIVLLLTLIFTWGIGLIFSVLNVFFRDVGNLLNVLLMFWLWVTPVFYSADMVPARFQWVSTFNPLTPYIACYREVLLRGHIPSPGIFLEIFLWSFFSLLTGLTIFSHLETKILKRI